MIDSSEPASKHDRNQLAAARMKRIANPRLERRPPGIVVLPRPASAKAGSPARSARRPAGKTSPSLYYRVPRLLTDLAVAHGDGRYSRLLRSIARAKLLILDDWGPETLTSDQARDLLEIIEDRYDAGSLVITSQVPVDRWHDMIGVPTIADAILDRVIHNAYRIELSGESLRKRRSAAPKTQPT